jgi:hypothetical protein
MTFKECLNKFHESFPLAEVDTYRPVCYEMFQADRGGMTIWLKNGDMVVYYPKQEAKNDTV